MNKIKSLRENILSALPLSMAKEYERMNKRLNNNKETLYYKVYKPVFDKAFGKDDKGRLIYRKYINVDNMPIDKEISEFLSKNGYNISEEEFNAGIIIKNKDDKNNHLSLEELQKKGMVLRIGRILNKKKAPQKLILKWDKIAKQISNKKLIVISRHPYDIAGQSTDRSWESCMTLETNEQEAGCNSHFVDSGIKAGVLIAYLISNDDKNINKPLARVLIKPLIKEIDRKAYFTVSKIYGVAGEEFKNTVQKWVDKNLNKRLKGGKYYLDDDNIYDDKDLDKYIILTKNILNNYSQEELYEEFNVVYDRENNIIYYSYDKPFIKNIKLKEANIHKVQGNTSYYDKKTKNLYIQKSKFNKNSVFFYNDIIIPYKKTKNLLYIIKNTSYSKWFDGININTNSKIIYIPKIYKGSNYKGFDFTNSYTIEYTDKIFANDDNIKELVNDLSISLKDIDVSNVTDMSDLFYESERKDFTGIEDWNTSNVEYMDYLFYSNNNFNGDISNWDTSKVVNMKNMFAFSEFSGNISNWDTSNVVDMYGMFTNSRFNGDISNWNVSNVEDMENMFSYSKFNGDISKWNVSNVKSMSFMFENSSFNGDISNWDTSNVKNMSGMFKYSRFNGDISNWNVSNVEDMENMFSYSEFSGNISKWNTRNVEDMEGMFYNSPLENNPPKWYKE